VCWRRPDPSLLTLPPPLPPSAPCPHSQWRPLLVCCTLAPLQGTREGEGGIQIGHGFDLSALAGSSTCWLLRHQVRSGCSGVRETRARMDE
jgi:hypothetical protein